MSEDKAKIHEEMKNLDELYNTIDNLKKDNKYLHSKVGRLQSKVRKSLCFKKDLEMFFNPDFNTIWFNSREYNEVLKHRRKCSKWGKKFCLLCFGQGLSHHVSEVRKELWEKLKRINVNGR